MRAALLLGAYNAVSEIAWFCLRTLAGARLVGSQWRLSERTGRYDNLEGASDEIGHDGPGVWIHAASVGEVRAAGALAGALSKDMPDARVMLTVLTTTGIDTARKKIPDIDLIVQAPVDLKGPITNTLSYLNPSLVILVETEMWPNMIVESARRGVAVAIVSGKISQESYQRYKLISPLMRHLLSSVRCVAAQTEADRERFCGLGLDPTKIEVTGDIKLDAELPESPPPAPAWLPELIGDKNKWLVCAGSTRAGEEDVVGKGVQIAAADLGDGLTLVVAPRHIERANSVALSLRNLGFDVRQRTSLESSEWTRGKWPRALVLDTIGELGAVYPECDIAFVGGTLAPHGGHNLAEPAAYGVPVLFGPHVEKTLTTARPLEESGGGKKISDSEELAVNLSRLLRDPQERTRMGTAAREAVKSLQGATERTLLFLRESGALPG